MTIEQSSQEKQNFELQDMKDLIKKLEDSTDTVTEEDFKSLDKNNSELSDAEKELFEKMWDSKDIIALLKWIVESIESKNSVKEVSKEETEKDIENKIKGLFEWKNTKDELFKSFSGTAIPQEYINEFLLKDENIKLLKLVVETWSYDLWWCPMDWWKSLKEKYIKIQKEEIKNKLINFTYENWEKIDIDLIFESESCKPINLVEKLKWLIWPNLEPINEQEIKNILWWTMNFKKLNTEIKVDDILKDYKLNISDFVNKTNDQISDILKEKNIPQETQDIIKNKLILINKIEENKKLIGMISKWTNYNELNNSYFLNNPDQIKNITNKEKLFEIIDLITSNNSTLAKNNEEKEFELEYLSENGVIDYEGQGNFWTKRDSIIEFNFNSVINENLQKDLNIYKEYSKVTWRKFTIKNIQNLDISANEDKASLIALLDTNALDYIIVKEWENINNVMSSLNNTNIVNLVWEKQKLINNDKIPTDQNVINALFNNNIQAITERRYEYDNYIKNALITDPVKITAFLLKNVYLLEYFPKTYIEIIDSREIISKFIKADLNFYKDHLKTSKQAEYSDIYLDNILNSNISNKEEFISKIKFKDRKDAIWIFTQIVEYNKHNGNTINFNKIIKYKEIRLTVSDLLNTKNKLEFSKEEKGAIKSIKEVIKWYSKTFDNFKSTYEKSNLKNSLKENKGWWAIEKLYEHPNFLKYLKEENPKIQSPIVGICRASLWDSWKEENINTFIWELAEEINSPEEFNKKLEEVNNFINDAFKEQVREEENISLDDETKRILESINPDYTKKNKEKWVNINYGWIDNDFNKYIVSLTENWEKVNSENIDKYIENFINQKGLNSLNEEWKNKIINHIKTKWSVELINTLAKKAKNDSSLYEAYASWNQEEIDRVLEKLNNDRYKNLKQDIEKYEHEKEIRIKNSINQVDQNSEYIIDWIPTTDWNNNYSININWEPINWLTKAEVESLWEEIDWKFVITNNEAAKNLVDFKDKMELLNLDFVWENRRFLVNQLNTIKWTSWIDITDSDNINSSELNKLLNFVLETIWEKWSDNINNTYSTIIRLNWSWMLNNKTDTLTWFSNIWKEFYSRWYINLKAWTVTSENKNKIQDRNNWK